MDNLDVETIEQIQDHAPSIINSEDDIVSIPDTEPDGTADSYTKVCQIPTLCPPLNQRTGTHLPVTNLTPKSAPVRRDCSRILPILNERPMDFLNRSPPNEKGQNHLRIQSIR